MLLAVDPMLQLGLVAGFIIALILFARFLNKQNKKRKRKRNRR